MNHQLAGRRTPQIKLETNFFPVIVENKDVEVVLYDIEIKPLDDTWKILTRRQKMHVFEQMKKEHSEVFDKHPLAFDSDKKAFSVGIIPSLDKCERQSLSYEVSKMNGNCDVKCRITLTLKSIVRMGQLMKALRLTSDQNKEFSMSMNIIQPFEIMFRHYRALKYELVGHRHFFPTRGEFGTTYPISKNMQANIGFFSSMRPASWHDGSLLLNIDVAHTAFYIEQPLIGFVSGVVPLDSDDLQRPLDPRKREILMRELKNIKITSTHGSTTRVYCIIGVAEHGPNRQTFPRRDKRGFTTDITVQEYFLQQYSKTLQYPNFNCVQVFPREKSIFLPMELCRIASGQKVSKKLCDREAAKFVRNAAVAPSERKKQICEINLQNNFHEDPMLQNLKFSIEEKPLRITGRVLPAPRLCMSHEIQPRDGVWDSKNCKVFRGAELKNWAIIKYISVSIHEVKEFYQKLISIGGDLGMKFSHPLAVEDGSRAQIQRDFLRLSKKHQDLQLLLVILGKDDNLYGKVKSVGDIDIGVMTQCVQGTTIKWPQSLTITNLLLKINAKLGGINSVLASHSIPSIFRQPVMIMGADVNHPACGDHDTPSLAAVVGSIDRHASVYAAEVMPQEHRMEIIQDICKMTKNLITTFEKKQKRKPNKIVMFRDGISESQFSSVLAHEKKAMREACAELHEDYNPGITFVVVLKRHHTRLFCQEREGVGRNKNIPPGTVVDFGITHPCKRDFYLCSHQGIQGTSRPSHYHVLWDDNNMSLDEIQSLTYNLCHLYSRCTRAVSIPAPAYYAHLAAYRGKVHLCELLKECDNDCKDTLTNEEIKQRTRVDLCNPLARSFYYI